MYNQQNSVFIAPEECGSSIGYYINVNEYSPKNKPTHYSLAATVVLTDCGHKIEWSFCDDKVDKIDAAIHMLQEFRKKYIQTEKLISKLTRDES